MISTVGSFDHVSMPWLGLERVGFEGGVTSILNGPRWTAADQLPALSRVRRWNHQEPSASGSLVALVAVVSWIASGEVVALPDHSIEYPETPLAPSAAPLQATAQTRSEDQSEGRVLESAGFAGAAESILN